MSSKADLVSKHSQYGSKYFLTEQDYDKLVYENTWNNVFVIAGALICFYIFNGLHWWACFELGIGDAQINMYY